MATIIAFITLGIGFFMSASYLWVPGTVLVAGIIDSLTRRWVVSARLGSAVNLSIILKFFLSLIGFYAMIGQIICIVLVFFWVK